MIAVVRAVLMVLGMAIGGFAGARFGVLGALAGMGTLVVIWRAREYYDRQQMQVVSRRSLEEISGALRRIRETPASDSWFPAENEGERQVRSECERLAEAFLHLKAQSNRLSALLDHLSDGIVHVDARRRVTLLNRAAQRLFNAKDADIGEPFLVLVGTLDLEQLLEDTLTQQVSMRGELRRPEAEIRLEFIPLGDDEGALVVTQDVTVQRLAERRQREFLANVAHELRTPLTLISGYAETLAEPDVPDADRERFRSIVAEEAQSLARIVDDLLHLARIEGEAATTLEIVPLQPLLERLSSRLRPVSLRKSIAMEVDIDPQICVFASPHRLEQIVLNLLDNALKYTGEHGRIRVRAHGEGEWAEVVVHDTGIGIRSEDLPHIFERFYRADRSRPRGQGAGLGLAIARELTASMGGSLTAISEIGSGSIFTLRLRQARMPQGE